MDEQRNQSASLPPGGSSIYNAGVAMEFFRSVGKPETAAKGETIFEENDKAGFLRRSKMYLILDGEVTLSVKGTPLAVARTGEIFGELASIGQSTRSATAVAARDCRLLTLDDKQFQAALQKKPEFALMMMSLIIARIRASVAKLAESQGGAGGRPADFQVMEKKLLAELQNELGDESVIHYEQNKIIMREGQPGVLMYIVLKGTVAIGLKGRIVERVGPGGVFGEMALVERSPRLASALAETDCSLLGVNRNAFLALVQARPDFGMSLLNAVGERARFVTSQLN